MATVDYHRFTLEEIRQGKAAGWSFAAGWFRRVSGLTWAWFWRPTDEE